MIAPTGLEHRRVPRYFVVPSCANLLIIIILLSSIFRTNILIFIILLLILLEVIPIFVPIIK